jgi:hypothetical protein
LTALKQSLMLMATRCDDSIIAMYVRQGKVREAVNALWTRRRLVLPLTLCLAAVVLAAVILRTLPSAPRTTSSVQVQRATPTPIPDWHPTYTLTLEGPSSDITAHPGDQLAFRWVPQRDAAPRSGSASRITCTVALYGPFSSREIAEHVAIETTAVAAPVAAALPLTLTRWTSSPQPVTLLLPTSLAPGYYVWIGQASDAAGGTITTADAVRVVQ